MTAGGTTFEFDRDATRTAYALTATGGADRCTCAGCRNFRLVRESGLYTPDFLLLLDTLGIDFRKEEEVYATHYVIEGKMLYGGWFYFVGSLLTPDPGSHYAGPPPPVGKEIYKVTHTGPGPSGAFAGPPMIAIDFKVYAPWRLDEPY